jgi:hypothetical protein
LSFLTFVIIPQSCPLSVIGTHDSMRIFAAAPMALMLPSGFGSLVLAGALVVFLAAGFFTLRSWRSVLADLVVLPLLIFRSTAHRCSADQWRRDKTP